MFVYLAFFIIILANIFYYRSLYNKQIEYITSLLGHQVLLTGINVDETNNSFASDLNELGYLEDLVTFFSDENKRQGTIDKIKLFYLKYDDLITGIKISDDRKNEYTF